MRKEKTDGVYAAHLVHPETRGAHACELSLSRQGLLLRLLTPEEGMLAAGLTELRWSQISGFSADESVEASDGRWSQILEISTTSGTLQLFISAIEASLLFADVSTWSLTWALRRHPLVRALGPIAETSAALINRLKTWLTPKVERVKENILVPTMAELHRIAAPLGGRLSRSLLGLIYSAGKDRASLWTSSTKKIFLTSLAILAALGLVALGLVLAPASNQKGGISYGLSGPPSMAMTAQDMGTQDKATLETATSVPLPDPPSIATQPPLTSHEVFGFAPYWTLHMATGFDVGDLTTIAYFSIGVNGNGSLAQSGPGWNGYESQDLVNLVNRAHAAGDRVVLTVNCFGQSTLNQLTSTPTAPTVLSKALIAAISAKNLDGVNFDFEGEGSGDQVGLTNLIARASDYIHAANPHYQVTMDTYASSAGDPSGFYNIKALARYVDAFFVMSYELNLSATPSSTSPLTSSMFSNTTTAEQYSKDVPASKVILGVPFYGYQWPTNNGTMAAKATGGATPLAYSTIVAKDSPTYWDTITQTAWTSYESGGQWYEDYFEDPSSVYLIAQMAQHFSLAGVGAWALGMDGNDPAMLEALDGNAPAQKAGPAGPAKTSTSTPPSSPTTTTRARTTTRITSTSTSTTTSTLPTSSPTTTTTQPEQGSSTGLTGIWQGSKVTLARLSQTSLTGTKSYLGELTGFKAETASLSCLAAEPYLQVWSYDATIDVVIAKEPTDCVTAAFSFKPSSSTMT